MNTKWNWWCVCHNVEPPARPLTAANNTCQSSHVDLFINIFHGVAQVVVASLWSGMWTSKPQQGRHARHRGKQGVSIPWSPRHYSSTSNVLTLLLTVARVRCNICLLTLALFRKAEPLGLPSLCPSSHSVRRNVNSIITCMPFRPIHLMCYNMSIAIFIGTRFSEVRTRRD